MVLYVGKNFADIGFSRQYFFEKIEPILLLRFSVKLRSRYHQLITGVI